MSYLRDSDREALRLAHGFREEMRHWLAHRGVDAPLSVSPFVDPSGQPSVLVTMSAEVARALCTMLAEQRGQASGMSDTADIGFPRQRAAADTGAFAPPSDTGGFRTVHDTGGMPLPRGAGMQPQSPAGTGGFAQPVNGITTGGFPQPMNGTAAFPQTADTGFVAPHQQIAPPPYR
jgi:hypothetical protein